MEPSNIFKIIEDFKNLDSINKLVLQKDQHLDILSGNVVIKDKGIEDAWWDDFYRG